MTDDDNAMPLVVRQGRHTHFTRGAEWLTVLASGETVEGCVPDPDYVEPKVRLDGCAAPEGVKRKLFSFKVLWAGWECDDKGWVVEMEDGKRAIVLSTHMRLYIAKPSELRKKLKEYERVMGDTRKALQMLNPPSRAVFA